MTDQRPPRDDLVRAVFPGAEMRDAAEGGPRVMTGHFSVFNQWTRIDSSWEGTFLERIAPGAFSKAFRESTPKVLFQHGKDPQIGDKPLGSIRSLSEDDTGAAYEVELLDTAYVRDLIPGLEAGLYGASFRFSVIKEDWDQSPRRSPHNPDGLPERTIREARVPEFGPVTFPAYSGATAGVRSMTDEFLVARLAADPERLASLIADALPTRAGALPHSDAGEPPADPPPAEEARATQEPPTGGSPDPKEIPVTDQMAPTRVDLPARIEELRALATAFVAEHPGSLTPDEDSQWRSLTADLQKAEQDQAADEARRQFIAERAKAPATGGYVTQSGSFQAPYVINSPRERVRNIHSVAEVRMAANDDDDYRTLLRDTAMRGVESAAFPHPDARPDAIRGHIQRLLDTKDDERGSLARRIMVTGGRDYERAFSDLVRGVPGAEARYAALEVVGTTTTGGYAVPYSFDPTLIPTGAYTNINPFRQICRVEQIVGANKWQGVSVGAVLAAYDTESDAISEGGPTFSNPSITVTRATCGITLSYETMQDRSDITSELAVLINEAKDTLEENKFAVGAGTNNSPLGAAVKSTFTVKETITDNTFAAADLDATEAALPLRHRRNAVWLFARPVIRIIQGWESAYGKLFNSTLGYPAVGDIRNNPGGNTGISLLGYPLWETPSVPVTVTTDDAIVGLLFNPSQYIIVDRVGMDIEILPKYDTGTGMPNGTRALTAVWRNSAGALNADGGRQVNIN